MIYILPVLKHFDEFLIKLFNMLSTEDVQTNISSKRLTTYYEFVGFHLSSSYRDIYFWGWDNVLF